jgi:dephospho-CoA kinase
MKVVAFVGYQASGKSTAAKVALSLRFPVVVMGDFVREETKRRGLPLRDEFIGEVAKDMRRKEGMDVVARRCLPKIESFSSKLVVVDGIRGEAEVKKFREVFGKNFFLVRIDAKDELRYARMKRRGRMDSTHGRNFRERDLREEGFGLKKAMELADMRVENEGSIGDFRKRVRELLLSLNR